MGEGWMDQAAAFLSEGGFVMWPLVATACLLWYGLGYRIFVIRRGGRAPLERLLETYRLGYDRPPKGILDSAVARGVELSRRSPDHLRWKLDDEFASYATRMGTFATLVRTTILVAPLLGLLGTVTGMIELFDSLGSQTFYSQSGGIARGIAEALFTTELGLAVAIPGLVVGRILERRQARIGAEIDRLKDVLCAQTREVTA